LQSVLVLIFYDTSTSPLNKLGLAVVMGASTACKRYFETVRMNFFETRDCESFFRHCPLFSTTTLPLTPFAYSYIQFSASKSSASQSDASQVSPDDKGKVENVELARARAEITELRVQLSDLSLGLSSKASELADSQREISRLQSLLQAR
jgi:hypothetical protein